MAGQAGARASSQRDPAAPAHGADGRYVPRSTEDGQVAGDAGNSDHADHTGQAGSSDDGAADALEAALDQLGPIGLYQSYMLVMLCIPNLLAAMYSLNYVFVADRVPFRCVVPECEGETPLFASVAAQALVPERCARLAPASFNSSLDACHPASYLNTTVSCELFVYENYDTTFAEFDLGCREWLRTMVGSVRNAALPLALVLTGFVSDNHGRRTAFCVFSACMGALGIVKSFSINYQMYLAFEFLEAAFGYGFASAAYVMMIEMAHGSLRAAFACATGVAYGAGGALFAWLAWQVRYWRHLLRVIHAPALLLPLYWLLLDESARWLHARARTQDAAAVIRKAARWNKVILDDEVMKKLEQSGGGDKPQAEGWRVVLGSRALRVRLALCGWAWVAVTFVYYGLTINVVQLAGDKFANFALNMAMEVVASLLIMMALERCGRRRSICAAFLLCGLACVLPYFISHSGTSLALFFVGKLAISFAFNSLYVLTAELFPTRARSSALAACSLLGRIGSILAPQTPLLSGTVQAFLYGACSVSAALSVMSVPETRRTRLPADVRDAERMRTRDTRAAPAPAPPPPPSPRVLSADM